MIVILLFVLFGACIYGSGRLTKASGRSPWVGYRAGVAALALGLVAGCGSGINVGGTNITNPGHKAMPWALGRSDAGPHRVLIALGDLRW